MSYHPETTVIQGLVHIIRERTLPIKAIPRPSHAITGAQVEAVNVLLEGDIMRDYQILDVAAALKLRQPTPEQMHDTIMVEAGRRVQAGQELARTGKGRRTKLLLAPADGVVAQVEGHRIVLQVNTRTLEVQAKIPGEIEQIASHRIQLAGNGALLQCAWGNGRFCYEAYKFLPEDGFVSLSKQDVRISEYRGVVIISPQPINQGDLLVAQQQEVGGVVAPSMPANLREFVLELTFPVLLTEGFGQCRPTSLIYQLLQDNMGRQAAFNAAIPDHWSEERPEIMIPLSSGGMQPPTPHLNQILASGAQVRITRAPWNGLIGEVVELPETPQIVGNGLRVPSAKVRLPSGRVRLVPLSNLELLG